MSLGHAWFWAHPRSDKDSVRLFCFPHAGGGASAYRHFRNCSPPGVEVVPVQLPGRESRWNEPQFVIFDELISELADVIQPFVKTPFACFGHSMGALIAYELVRRLRRDIGREPIYLFVSACGAPHLARSGRLKHSLSDDDLVNEVRALHGLPDQLSEDSEAMTAFLPRLRADLTLCASYRFESEHPLSCPIAAFCGRDDTEVALSEMAGWSVHTANGFMQQDFAGGHFYIEDRSEDVLKIISTAMTPSHARRREPTQ